MFLALVPILPGTPSEYLGALALDASTYEASVPATRLVTLARSLSFFLFRVRYLSFLFALSS
jgi:hypothetical protein